MARVTRAAALRAGAAVAAYGTLIACGGQAPGGATGAGTTAPPATPARREVSLIVDNDWTQGDRYKVVQSWLERASRVYPNIKTELRDNADSQDKTIALFAGDQQGDLVQLDQHLIPVLGPKGVLQEIDSTLAALKFDPATLYDVPNITHWDGKRHGLLIQLNSFNWIYNLDAFREAGVKEPSAQTGGWTWDDVVDAAKRLTRTQGGADDRWGTNISGEPYPFFWSANAPYLDPKGTRSLWDSTPAREVVQWLVDLAQRLRVAPTQKEATDKKLNFNNGQYAINQYAVPSPAITKAIDNRFQWEVAPAPRHPRTGKAVNTVTGHNYLVTKKGQQRGVLTEATQVLLELYDKEIQDLYLSGLNVSSLPILKATAARAGEQPGMPKQFKIALDVIPNGQNFEKVVGFLDFHSAWRPEFWKAVDGEVTVEQAVVNMTRASDAALQQAAR
jgi:ABC-type glycerol-3-phosphate transport system substrate-binding protein